MPKFTRLSRPGPVGIALTAYELWSRLTPAQRRRLLQATRKHGPTIARAVAKRANAKRRP